MELNKVYLYRITHIENIEHILLHGITHKKSANKNVNYKNIGDLSLIDTRNKKTVIIDNGSSEQTESVNRITLGDYIPFYFGVKMPMLYVVQHGGNFVKNATPPDEIIYLCCSLSSILSDEVHYYFSDGHATDILATFYDNSKINELVKIIDWEAVMTSYRGGNDNLNLKRKKQAEFLIANDVSPDHIIGFGCYNEKVRLN